MNPAQLTAAEAARLIRASQLKSEDLVRACLERIAERDGEIGPWTCFDAQQALRRARELDRAAGPRGVLHGIPVGVKASSGLSAAGEAPLGLNTTGDAMFNRIWTLLGAPCVHVPSGVGPRGLPLGVQVVGTRGSDLTTLRCAHWIESKLGTRGAIPVNNGARC